jgi:hypothetical protein
MSQHIAGETEADPAEVRTAFATLVAGEPALPSGSDDIERRGRRRLARRRLAGLAVVVMAAGAAGLVAVTVAGTGAGPTSGPVAGPPAPPVDVTDPGGAAGGPAGGAQLAQGFTVDAAVTSLLPALPSGVNVGELPMDIGWREGGTLDIPLDGADGHGVLTIRIADGSCSASVAPAGLLSAGQLDAATDAVCAAWVADGSPAIVPAGPPGPEQPDLANQ